MKKNLVALYLKLMRCRRCQVVLIVAVIVAVLVTAYFVNPGDIAGKLGLSRKMYFPVPGYKVGRGWEAHKGVDIGAPEGTPIYAGDHGEVTFAGATNNSCGTYVSIKHPAYGVSVNYCHMSAIAPDIEAGTTVARGQLIGYVGWTGNVIPKNSSGSHLHLTVWRGEWASSNIIDPLEVFPSQ